jgi:soluble lytic murein transglycosylase-like protein
MALINQWISASNVKGYYSMANFQKETNTLKLNPSLNPESEINMIATERYDSLFVYYAELNDVDPMLLKAQVKQESAFDPDAVSRVGASGLTQFMPATFKEWSKKLGLEHSSEFNPEHAIASQAAYMASLLKRYHNDTRYALAAYNWGMGRVDHEWKDPEPWETDIQQMPQETREYVMRISKTYQELSGKELYLGVGL